MAADGEGRPLCQAFCHDEGHQRHLPDELRFDQKYHSRKDARDRRLLGLDGGRAAQHDGCKRV